MAEKMTILPCPFCGAPAAKHKNPGDRWVYYCPNGHTVYLRHKEWQARAHISQPAQAVDAEIARLTQGNLGYAQDNANLIGREHVALKRAERTESRLAAADALLRECYGFMQSQSIDQRSWGETLSLGEKIDAHLSENGYEK